jgi:hypothetical protein
LYLFYIDKSEIEENTDLNKLNSFIRKYQSFKLQNISTIIDKRNTIWKDQLTKSESIDYKDAKDFILTTKSTEQMVDEILNRMNAEISNTIYSSLVDFIKEKIQSQFSFGEQKKTDDLTSFLLKQIDLSVKISNGRIYQLLKVTKKLSSSEIWEDIARQIGLNELVQMKTIYVKSFGESNNFIEVLQLDNLGVAKKVYFEFSVNGLIPLSDVKTNYPIYNAIKTRYQISTFSIPQFRSKNDRGYEVLLYGYATGNMPCCPTYEIKMLYAKNINSLEPITAISVNSNYNTIETSTNLTQYFKLDKQIFTTE